MAVTLPIFTVEQLTPQQVATVEDRMRPNKWSVAGFLTEQQSLLDVASRDQKTLKERKITYEQIADKLQSLMCKCSALAYPRHLPLAEGKYLIQQRQTKGYQTCPFTFSDSQHDDCGDHTGSSDYCITRLDTNEQFKFASLMPHLIGDHHFFQGGAYRLDPEKAIAFFELQENVSYNLKHLEVWNEVDSLPRIDEDDSQYIKSVHPEHKELAQGVDAYMIKGEERVDNKKRQWGLILSNIKPSQNYLYITCKAERQSLDLVIGGGRLQEVFTKNTSYLLRSHKTKHVIPHPGDTSLPVVRVVYNGEGKAIPLNAEFISPFD